MKIFSSFALVLCLVFSLVGCSNKVDPRSLQGTWYLHRGEVTFQYPSFERQMTFRVNEDGEYIKAFYTNGNEFTFPLKGRRDSIVFKPNGEYVLYHGGLMIGREEIFDGLSGYEAGTYSIDGNTLTFSTLSQQGFQVKESRQRPAFEIKQEENHLTVIWREAYQVNDIRFARETLLVQAFSKLIFLKASNDSVLPDKIPQGASTPDNLVSPINSFFGLSFPNSTFFPSPAREEKLVEDQRIYSDHALLGIEIPAKIKTYDIEGIGGEQNPAQAGLTLAMFNRMTAEEYLAYRLGVLSTQKYTQVVFNGNSGEIPLNGRNGVTWFYREYMADYPKGQGRVLEAVCELPPSELHPTRRVYVVSANMERFLEKEEERSQMTRDWQLLIQRPTIYYLTQEATFSF